MGGDGLGVLGNVDPGGSGTHEGVHGDKTKDAWVLVLVGCLLWLQVGTRSDARVGLGWWHGVWAKQGHGCPRMEGAV